MKRAAFLSAALIFAAVDASAQTTRTFVGKRDDGREVKIELVTPAVREEGYVYWKLEADKDVDLWPCTEEKAGARVTITDAGKPPATHFVRMRQQGMRGGIAVVRRENGDLRFCMAPPEGAAQPSEFVDCTTIAEVAAVTP